VGGRFFAVWLYCVFGTVEIVMNVIRNVQDIRLRKRDEFVRKLQEEKLAAQQRQAEGVKEHAAGAPTVVTPVANVVADRAVVADVTPADGKPRKAKKSKAPSAQDVFDGQ
jgi:heme exporter protein D